jgi:hypothetical protein
VNKAMVGVGALTSRAFPLSLFTNVVEGVFSEDRILQISPLRVPDNPSKALRPGGGDLTYHVLGLDRLAESWMLRSNCVQKLR